MNRIAVAAALVLAATQLVACLPGSGGGGCGGGEENQVLARGQDQLILCDNGGYVLDIGSAQTGGMIQFVTGGIYDGYLDAGSNLTFALTFSSDGSTASAPQLGSAWTVLNLDEDDLDTSNTLCMNLEAQPWWTGSTSELARLK